MTTPWQPARVVAPASAEEVCEVLADAEAEGLAVVPVGGGSDPGCVPPARPWIALSTRALAEVEDYEPADLTITAGAGVVLGDLDRVLGAQRQWLPSDPPHAVRRTLGGLVASGAVGPLGLTYGAPRDHVLGLTLVTGDGRILRLGGRVMKNVAGFDLVKLVVGSRGTLGVVVSATVRLFPRPEEDRLLVVRADHPAALVPVARRVAMSAVVPASAVLVAPVPETLGDGGTSALVVRLHGARAAVQADEERLRRELAAEIGRIPGAASPGIAQALADHASAGEVRVRVTALPAALGTVLSAVADALGAAVVVADVLSGRVRAEVVNAEEVDAGALGTLRQRVEALGGSMTLERAPTHVVAAAGAFGDRGAQGSFMHDLRARFDPRGLLSPGMFVS